MSSPWPAGGNPSPGCPNQPGVSFALGNWDFLEGVSVGVLMAPRCSWTVSYYCLLSPAAGAGIPGCSALQSETR